MRVCVVALLAALVVAPTAAAQKMSPGEARTVFKEAQELYQANRCADALPKFEKLAQATESPNAQLYVARCLRKLDRLPESYEAFSSAIRIADAKAKEDERYAETRSAAAAERAALESKVARIVIAVADPPEGLRVRLGTLELESARIGEPVAVQPGSVEVRASAPGHKDFTRTLEVAGGSSSTVAVSLEAGTKGGAAAVDTSTEPNTDATADDGASAGPPVLAYVALGVGAAGLATFGVAGYLADQRFKSLEDDCKGGPCPEDKRDDIDGGRQLDTIANVGLVVGGVGLATGAALLLFGGSKKKAPPKTEAFVSPTFGGANVVVSGRF